MSRKPGSSKTGGRQAGTPNKKTKELAEKCEELGVDPFEILLRFAKGDWEGLGYISPERVKMVTESGHEIYEDTIPAELRAHCAKDACQYLHPRRKAIELAGDEDKGFVILVKDYGKKDG